MKKKNLEFEFFMNNTLNKEKYDFSDEGAAEEYKKLKGIEKYFAYKSVVMIKNSFVNLICVKDPDSDSNCLQKIYRKLWDNEKYIKQCSNKGKITGDTLNSVQTTLDVYYGLYEKPEHKEQRNEIKKRIGTEQSISIKYMLTRFFSNEEKYKEDFSFVDNRVIEFLDIYHTLGNFMPVPVGCNGPRGTGALNDYWDLTLKCIKNYYDSDIKDKVWIEKIVKGGQVRGRNKIKEKIAAENRKVKYAEWLESFGTWERFIEDNYLQEFIDANGKPKELWDNHFEDWKNKKSVLPHSKEQCISYFYNATKCIEKRTEKMLEKLQPNNNKSSDTNVSKG